MTQAKVKTDSLEQFVEDSQALQVDTDVDAQQRANREKVLALWHLDRARQLAAHQDILLSEQHLAVVQVLRDHYLERGEAQDARELEEMLAERFAEQGGKTYLHRLFPKGPVTQGMTIADLPLPPHATDSGFGTAR